MNSFSQVNKSAKRVSNCCIADLATDKEYKKYICCKCGNNCETISFYEQLTENLSNIFLGEKIHLDIMDESGGFRNSEILIPANKKITKSLIQKVAANYQTAECDPSPIRNKLREYISKTAAQFGVEY
jgi:hypothetical protein